MSSGRERDTDNLKIALTNVSVPLAIWDYFRYTEHRSGKKWVKVVVLPWSAGFLRRSAVIKKVEIMFLGRHEHTIDEKGRMIIPARFRELLQDGAYILQGFDRNLMILTAPSFEKISQRIDQMSLTDSNARLLRRLIFSKAERLEIDKAGRALIPQYLRDSARLGSNAMVVGSGAYIEIWSPELWAQQDEELNENDADAQRFAALDLSML